MLWVPWYTAKTIKEVFLGRSVTTHKNLSEATLQQVDAGDSSDHRHPVFTGA